MPRVISDTHTLIAGKPGAPERVPPGNPASVSKADAEGLVRAGIARLADDQPLPPAENSEKESAGTGERMQEVKGNKLDNRINLNTATAAELTAIKGVGKATARDIVAHRKKAGPFESLADCAERVGGVSVEQLEAADVTV